MVSGGEPFMATLVLSHKIAISVASTTCLKSSFKFNGGNNSSLYSLTPDEGENALRLEMLAMLFVSQLQKKPWSIVSLPKWIPSSGQYLNISMYYTGPYSSQRKYLQEEQNMNPDYPWGELQLPRRMILWLQWLKICYHNKCCPKAEALLLD